MRRRRLSEKDRAGPRARRTPAGRREAGREGAAGSASAASTSAVAGLEPAAGRGGGPRSAAAGLLGALHLVMTSSPGAARAEKEGCQPAGIPGPGPAGCHRALAWPLPAGDRGGRAAARGSEGGRAQGSVRREVARPTLVPSRELAVRMPTCGFDRTELLLFSVILSPRLPLVSCHFHFKTS